MPRISPKSNAEQLWSALVEPAVKNWLGDRGFVLADFNGQRNMLDVLRDDAFQRDLDGAIRGSAQADRPSYEKLLKGMATVGGVKWTKDHDALAKTVFGDIAQIAPYMQRWAPDVFDQLHGSKGSVSSLTHAIAEANRNTLSPVDAHAHAQQIFDSLYNQGDHLTTRGFSAQDMGKMYKHLARRGAIGAGAKPKDIARRLSEHAGPISAIRDSLNFQRSTPATLDEIFDAYDAIPHESRPQSHQEFETQLRAGDLLNRQGGLFSAATQATGPLPPELDMQQLEQQDQQLRRQAVVSPYGNRAGAIARMQEMGLDPNTVDPAMFRDVLNHYEANTRTTRASPMLTDSVRRQQGSVDLQPRVTNMTQSFLGKGPGWEQLGREGAAGRLGFQSAGHMDALHGPATQNVQGVMQQARQQAGNAQAVSGIGMQQPLQRMTQGLMDAKRHG